MKIGNRVIDHLVYSVPNLEEAMQYLYDKTGIEASPGGQHLLKGTENALVNLGDECYLEILAADDSISNIDKPRWMGIDLIERPLMTRWAIKSNDLEADSKNLKKYNPKMGKIITGERQIAKGGMLKWRMIEPLAKPLVDLAPFMIDWAKDAKHPTEGITQNARMTSLKFYHHKPYECSVLINDICKGMLIEKSNTTSIKVELSGPKGSVAI